MEYRIRIPETSFNLSGRPEVQAFLIKFFNMNKGILIIQILLILRVSLYSQENTWETIYSTPLNELAGELIEAADGSIYIAGFQTKPNEFYGHSEGLIIKLDKYGSTMDDLYIGNTDRRFYINRLIAVSQDSIIVFGVSTDTIRNPLGGFYEMKLEFKWMDEDLQIVHEKAFSFPPQYRSFISEMSEGIYDQYLISGCIHQYDSSFTSFPFLYILNENLDSMAARFYLDIRAMPHDAKQLPDSSIWLTDDLSPSYYIIDNEMNFIEYEYARPHHINSPYGIKWDTDTSFYMTGEWDDGNDHDIGLYRQLHPIDTSNNMFKSWGTSYLDMPAFSALDFHNKDSIFIGGTKAFGMFYATWPTWYYVLQTDSNLNIRWERFYGGDACYWMQKIIAANDGGCIIVGTRYDYQNVSEEELDIHVLKLNSEGLLVGTPEQPGIEMREALVFPNPGTDYLKVRVAAHYKKSIFELYDISGKIVLSEQINGKWGEVNTVALKSGTYVYRIYNEGGLFESGKWLKK